MSSLLFLALAAYGLWYTIGRGRISQTARDWLNSRFPLAVAMLECPGCFGFWTGFVIAAFEPTIIRLALPFVFVATNRLLHGLASFGDVNDHTVAAATQTIHPEK